MKFLFYYLALVMLSLHAFAISSTKIPGKFSDKIPDKNVRGTALVTTPETDRIVAVGSIFRQTPATGTLPDSVAAEATTTSGSGTTSIDEAAGSSGSNPAVAQKVIAADAPFVTRWNLATAGSGDTQLSFGVATSGVVNYTWTTVPAGTSGSGTFSGTTATLTGLPAGATIDVSISPVNFQRINIANKADKNRLEDVKQWGTVAWTSMEGAFVGCTNLAISATDIPDLSGVTNMSFMFANCTNLNGPTNIGTWNTAAVTNMSNLFYGAFAFNQNIGTWNTAAVTNMSYMFRQASAFNQNIGAWNTAAVTNMSYMFFLASAFNQDIGAWNTSAVTDMNNLFYSASTFNQNIGSWNTSAVTNMSYLFGNASAFNQNIGSWNTATVTNMSGMFASARAFNQNIGSWNTSAVTNMASMFNSASAFNQNIGVWNTAAVTRMDGMFLGASAFNENISDWNTAAVTNMSNMFNRAGTFNQNIGGWNTAAVTRMDGMFSDASAFNQNIGSWSTSAVTNMASMFYGASTFNQDISAWNTAAVTNMSNMFYGASTFNQDISAWNTAAVTNMANMFNGASAFNQNIGLWKTSAVTNMATMFYGASTFNQDISTWNTGAVTSMSNMFNGASAFNQDIGLWSTSAVTNMANMFYGASTFNQDISSWNIGAVTNMSNMFNGASAFNQSLSAWGAKFNPNVNLAAFLNNCGMNISNYDATLTGFNAGTLTGRTMGATGRKYCGSTTARANLVLATGSGGKGWTITGDSYGTPVNPTGTLNPTVCAGSTASLTATCTDGTVSWYNASSSSLLSTGSPYVTPNLTTATTYQVRCEITGGAGCTSGFVTVSVSIDPIAPPTNATVDKTVICANTTIALSATCGTGTPIWYNQPTGGTSLGTGNIVQSPTTTTTYYAGCTNGTCASGSRTATAQVVVTYIGSNLNLTAPISGSSIQAASNSITATNTILTGAQVRYVASSSILLLPQAGGGFQVENGAVFEARIMPLVGCQ
ncbi:BspA family leucine-rich repeat surface protein [Emticicia sp. C21]|uniref:BspA family leucine-rich repeat surface protein n=1 Tax=Emticicia sp. C21 TaxID=2302915 RepID=UPI000E34F5D7|nr:BspA family leucine-rich repeat surface protein [Emticicia sp. C21]RFS17092.1 BspA family leucine-rich repeat surface protein [Emticicia sp. C21]